MNGTRNGHLSPALRTPLHTFAAGWNARCGQQVFKDTETEDWKTGWLEAGKVAERFRWPFNSDENFARRVKSSG